MIQGSRSPWGKALYVSTTVYRHLCRMMSPRNGPRLSAQEIENSLRRQLGNPTLSQTARKDGALGKVKSPGHPSRASLACAPVEDGYGEMAIPRQRLGNRVPYTRRS